MRIFKQFMLLLMTISLVTFTGCSNNDDNDDGGGGGAAGTITAKVDGAAFTSIDLSSVATLAAGNLIIQGADADGKSIVMTIFGYSGEGTYEFTGVDPLILHIANYIEVDIANPANTQSWTAPFDGTLAGSVTITMETTDNVEGTFEFTGKNAIDMTTKSITEGSFDLSKQSL